MRIEFLKQTDRAIGDIVECVSQRIRLDSPDEEPTIVIQQHPFGEVIERLSGPLDGIADLNRLALAVGFEPAETDPAALDPGPRPDDAWKKIPLRVFAVEFFKHHFEYLGPHGAEEMADRFMQSWSEFH